MQASSSPVPDNGQRARLYWQCRRGMLELDCMLNAYLDSTYEKLSRVEVEQMEKLLEFPDPVLLEWLMGRMVPFDKDVANLVEQIRNTTTSQT